MTISPLTGRREPSKANSPKKIKLSTQWEGRASCAARIPKAMAKSKEGPSFLMSAGARLIVTRSGGKERPLFLIADRTLSLDSFTP